MNDIDYDKAAEAALQAAEFGQWADAYDILNRAVTETTIGLHLPAFLLDAWVELSTSGAPDAPDQKTRHSTLRALRGHFGMC